MHNLNGKTLSKLIIKGTSHPDYFLDSLRAATDFYSPNSWGYLPHGDFSEMIRGTHCQLPGV